MHSTMGQSLDDCPLAPEVSFPGTRLDKACRDTRCMLKNVEAHVVWCHSLSLIMLCKTLIQTSHEVKAWKTAWIRKKFGCILGIVSGAGLGCKL